jgi:uncharacterized membrane protein YwaF
LTTSVAVQILITGENILVSCFVGIGVPLIAALLPTIQMLRTEIIDQIRYGA